MGKGGKNPKRPTTGPVSPSGKKKPWRIDPQIAGGPLAWRFSACDRYGPFGWSALAHPEKHKEIIEKLHEFETKTMDQLQDAGCHSIEIEQICKDARDRLPLQSTWVVHG